MGILADLRTNYLMSRFKNVSYFTDLNRYITEMVTENKLSYNNLKYLYDNLYKGKSEFIKQNIYPVCEFLMKGYTGQEAEQLADLLEDAKDKTIFCYEPKETGYIYNKLFYDLKFVFTKYNEIVASEMPKDVAFKTVADLISTTITCQRQYEMESLENKYISKWQKQMELTILQRDISVEMEKVKQEFEATFPEDETEDIIFAGLILEEYNLDKEMEESPFTKEQEALIYKYLRLETTLEDVEAEIDTQEELEEEIIEPSLDDLIPAEVLEKIELTDEEMDNPDLAIDKLVEVLEEYDEEMEGY